MASKRNYEYMNENSIPQDLRCSICTEPFDEPVSADKCGHTYCKACITKALKKLSKCPTCRSQVKLGDFRTVTLRPFLNQLNQILVKCNICSQQNIERGNISDHFTKCPKMITSCPAASIKCNWTGAREKLQSHIRECQLIKVQPIIDDLSQTVKHQSEKIQFLYEILKKISQNHKNACGEAYKSGYAYCDMCGTKIELNTNSHRLHYCPQTDVCPKCVEKHFH